MTPNTQQLTPVAAVERESISFGSSGSSRAAWIFRPRGSGDRRPVIVMAHGLGAVKEMRLDAYAERFAAAGYVCLAFDYRGFGESGGHPRQHLSVRSQLEDWSAAIAHARSLPGVDPARVVIWGTSFGGGHVLSVAARDREIVAAIAQCPFTDGLASTLATDRVTGAKVAGAAAMDLLRVRRRKDPVHLPLAGGRRARAFMTAADSFAGMQALTAGVEDYENRMTARSAFEILRYAPGRRARDISCPLLVTLCEHDTITPAGVAQRQVARAARAEVHLYSVGHYDVYFGEPFERAVGDYLRFLDQHVPVDSPARGA